MRAYLALAALLFLVASNWYSFERGENGAELACKQSQDKEAAKSATGALQIQQAQAPAADKVVTVYVDKIRYLPSAHVVLDRLGLVCDSAAVGATPGGNAVPGDVSDFHGAGGGDASDRRAELARELGACYRNTQRLTGLQGEVRAKSADGVQP